MSSLILAFGAVLLASPVYEAGLQGGGGIVGDELIMSAQPWVGAQRGLHSVSLAVPLRLELDSGGLRDEDWDDWRDYGRVFRLYRYDEVVFIGQLNDVTLGHGTIVRRFRNGVDDDYYRIGTRADLLDEYFTLTTFSDQVLDIPLAGARMTFSPSHRWVLGTTIVADFAKPQLTGESSGYGREVWSVVGADLGWSLWNDPSQRIHFYVDTNLQASDAFGAHVGVEWHMALAVPWALSGRVEAMGFEDAYVWAPFDTGYLIRRWSPHSRGAQTNAGARLMFVFTALEHLSFGFEYADGFAAHRSDLSAWATLPFDQWRIDGFWVRRDGHNRLDVLDPRDMIGGLSLRLLSGQGLDAGLTVARAWREDEERHQYAPFTEVLLTLERGWGF